MGRDKRPIESLYSGVRYRSKLEAVWAAFYLRLDLTPDYELMEFQTPHGVYLPDFYIHELGIWHEVKPTQPDPESVVFKKAAAVMEETGKPFLVTWGQPAAHTSTTKELGILFSGAVAYAGTLAGMLVDELESDISGERFYEAATYAHRCFRWEPYDIDKEIRRWNPLWLAELDSHR